MSKTTTPEQYEKLAEYMATKSDIAGGYHKRQKEEVEEFWEEVSLTLNSMGPPTKQAAAWKKVWIDWKCYIKRKLTTNKKEMMSTGGGPCRLQRISALEDKVIKLAGLATSTNGIGGTYDFGVASAMQVDSAASENDISAPKTIFRSEDPAEIPTTSRRRQKQLPKDSTASLLKDIFTSQEAFYTQTTNFQEGVITYMRRLSRNVERLADTADRRLAEEQRHNKIKEELLQQKVQIKLQMLHLQHPDLNLRLSPDMGQS